MADYLLQATLSNLLVASLLTLLALSVQQWLRAPSLANLLWAFVLIKLITPPLFSLSLLGVPRLATAEAEIQPIPSVTIAPPESQDLEHLISESNSTVLAENHLSDHHGIEIQDLGPVQSIPWLAMLMNLWLIVSAFLLCLSLIRIVRFHRLLKQNSQTGPNLTRRISRDLARLFNIKNPPPVVVTSANIAPFVWWLQSVSIIVISRKSIEELSESDLRWVIAHEMAHIKRRDHWFRWIECFSSIVFWWNPLIGWVRHQLRKTEELACDELVLKKAGTNAHQYAHALLNVAELLSTSAIRPPNMATAINSGGILEKRLKMIIADQTGKVPSVMRLAIAALAFAMIPLGVVYAQDFEAIERRLGGAVEAGEITLEQANLMLNTLRKAKYSKVSPLEEKKRRYEGYAKDIGAAVKAGKMAKEDAEKKLLAIRNELFTELESNKTNYRNIQRELEAAVKAGKLSKEDAEKKLIGLRKGQYREAYAKAEQKTAYAREVEEKKKIEKFRAIQKEMTAAVKAGKLSLEDAEKKMYAIRKEMFGAVEQKQKQNQYLEKKRAAYNKEAQKYQKEMDLYYREVEAAVKAGKMSKEAAQKKLIEAKEKWERTKKDWDRKQSYKNSYEAQIKVKKFAALEREVDAAVKAGKLSKEEAKKKLIQARQSIQK